MFLHFLKDAKPFAFLAPLASGIACHSQGQALLRGGEQLDEVCTTGVELREVRLGIDLQQWLFPAGLAQVSVHGDVAVMGHCVQGHTVFLQGVLGNLVPVVLGAAEASAMLVVIPVRLLAGPLVLLIGHHAELQDALRSAEPVRVHLLVTLGHVIPQLLASELSRLLLALLEGAHKRPVHMLALDCCGQHAWFLILFGCDGLSQHCFKNRSCVLLLD